MLSRKFALLNFMCLYTLLYAANNFGKTQLRIKSFEKCKGPKRVDCCITNLQIDSPTKLTMNLDVTENIRLTNGKVVGYSNGKEMLRFPAKKPCDSIIINSVFRKYINITENCTVLKGSFDLLVTKFDQCVGPKRKECAVAIAKVTDQYNLDYDIDIKENVRTTKGKIIVLTKGKETLRLQVKDPCKHLFLKPLFQSMLNVTADCLILKGHYHFTVDIQDVARKYYGGEFLFGNWTFKSVFYNDVCTFSCSVIEVSIVPKNKVKN